MGKLRFFPLGETVGLEGTIIGTSEIQASVLSNTKELCSNIMHHLLCTFSYMAIQFVHDIHKLLI